MGGGQDDEKQLWQLGGLTFCWKLKVKISWWRKGMEPKWRQMNILTLEWQCTVSRCICKCLFMCDLILHLFLCFPLASLSSSLGLLLSAHPISVCLRPLIDLYVAASLRQLMWLSPLAVYPTLKVLNNSSGSTAGLLTAQISVQGGWGEAWAQ